MGEEEEYEEEEELKDHDTTELLSSWTLASRGWVMAHLLFLILVGFVHRVKPQPDHNGELLYKLHKWPTTPRHPHGTNSDSLQPQLTNNNIKWGAVLSYPQEHKKKLSFMALPIMSASLLRGGRCLYMWFSIESLQEPRVSWVEEE